MSENIYLVIKLSDHKDGKIDPLPFGDYDALKKRAEGQWRLTLKTMARSDKALALYHGKVVAEYLISDEFKLNRENGRITLHLIDPKKKDPTFKSKYVGRILDYPTSNPITVLNTKDIKYKD